jgi:hypothetical protein
MSLIDDLKRVKPTRVTVVLTDDEHQAVAVPRGGRRWERLAATIERLAWCEVRLQDGRGALLATVLREDAPADLEELATPGAVSGGPTSINAVAAALGSVMSAVVRDVTRHVTASMQAVVTSMRQEGSKELTAILETHRDVSAIAFEERAAAILRADQAEERAAAAEAELARVTATATDPAASRMDAIIGLLGRGSGKDSGGMPSS